MLLDGGGLLIGIERGQHWGGNDWAGSQRTETAPWQSRRKPSRKPFA
jgi:hypothetical protein